ncbi:hypothetical protein Y1Q_0016407 [Alligator mississippiensis]|uniref:Uncharacterized protein n=1 Tax=Alligator mississippiensis TaxID=8496 RepID=A0A151N2N8_ALLMI|nr:hypothetical protein Y1Q_0016407 [Alligator mississippiensis]
MCHLGRVCKPCKIRQLALPLGKWHLPRIRNHCTPKDFTLRSQSPLFPYSRGTTPGGAHQSKTLLLLSTGFLATSRMLKSFGAILI